MCYYLVNGPRALTATKAKRKVAKTFIVISVFLVKIFSSNLFVSLGDIQPYFLGAGCAWATNHLAATSMGFYFSIRKFAHKFTCLFSYLVIHWPR